nr:dynamin family protein [Rubricella aquisinus]
MHHIITEQARIIGEAADGARPQQDGKEAAVLTVIGQVKAGKTALTTALSGQPGLLPIDVNPWTSVVTSLNFNQRSDDGNRAIFQFFDRDEWRRIVEDGGRLGEMAQRAGREDELEKLRAQVERMYDRSKKRLGRNFELLLGQRHAFDDFDHALLERYICMGDDDAVAPGRYADITRSADLYLDAPQYQVPLTLRDTPGVNDPFLVREQITLRALSDADVYLVVLSAHQALSTTDLGLMRILASLKQERIILFVNRIDELPNPEAQMAEIKERMLIALDQQHLPPTATILFGSALWAQHALDPEGIELPDHSLATLGALGVTAGDRDAVWEVSGLPTLQEAIGTVMLDGGGARMLDTACRSLLNHAQRRRTLLEAQTRAMNGAVGSGDRLADQLDPLIKQASDRLETEINAAVPRVLRRVQETVTAYSERECDRLRQARTGDERAEWRADVHELRRDLALQVAAFTSGTLQALEEVLETTAQRLSEIQAELLGQDIAEARITPPNGPDIPAPVMLSQTITLDMEFKGWKALFSRFTGVEGEVSELRKMINREVLPMTQSLREDYILRLATELRDTLREFLSDQSERLLTLAEQTGTQTAVSAEERIAILRRAEADLAATLSELDPDRTIAA